MQLQILVPQYKEDEKIVKCLLDSIAMQQYINFNEIQVLICNDGTDVLLSEEFLNSYNFSIGYIKAKHKGVSATRNLLLKKESAKYVMFCDADDCFISTIAISTLYAYMQQDFDIINSCFTESVIKDNVLMYYNHEDDYTFVHGKLFKRSYLIDNNLFFDPELTFDEDSKFMFLAFLNTRKTGYVKTPFYMWKFREGSVARANTDNTITHHTTLIDNYDYGIEHMLIANKRYDEAGSFTLSCLIQTYGILYARNENWLSDKFKEYREAITEKIKAFYNKYKDYYIKSAEKLFDSRYKELDNKYRFKKFENVISYNDWIKSLNE